MKPLLETSRDLQQRLSDFSRLLEQYQRLLQATHAGPPDFRLARQSKPADLYRTHHRHLIAGGRKKWLLRRWRR